MKRIVSWILIAVMMVCCAGCTSGEQTPEQLSAGFYVAATEPEGKADEGELYLWENGVGMLVTQHSSSENGALVTQASFNGISWTPDSLRIEREDIPFGLQQSKTDPEKTLLEFSFGGTPFCFVLAEDPSEMPVFWGSDGSAGEEIPGSYLGETGEEAVFYEDGTGVLKADGAETPFCWGVYKKPFLIIDSFLSHLDLSDGCISFTTGLGLEFVMEPEEIVREREAYLPLGNAGELDGRIVVFTVFASGSDYRWDFSKPEDVEKKEKCLKDLSEATAYLTENAARYGKNAEFLYDWNTDPQLATEYAADYPMAKSAKTKSVAYELASARQLKEKYGADQVIYLFIVNTDYENEQRSHANRYDPDKIEGKPALTDLIEYVKIDLRYSREWATWDAQSSTYAHEILHLFGVPDLYKASTLITQEYADHLDAVMRTAQHPDIMYGGVAGWSVWDHVFSDVDAYYAGLTDHCEDVEAYGLGKSQHRTDQ